MLVDEAKRAEYFSDHPSDVALDMVDMARIPRHISCIMDGNGRWATARGLARTEGHKAGIVSLREIITACVRLDVEVLPTAEGLQAGRDEVLERALELAR